MIRTLSRRRLLAGAAALVARPLPRRPDGVVVDTHIHLFAADRGRFPYHANAPYRPEAQPLESYLEFARAARIDHVVIVHPEPYQDDHRYLEHCLAREPRRGFFKGTCLFDPIDAKTPERMEALAARHPGRIVALRIHAMRDRGARPATSGAIRDRDLSDPRVKEVWRKARALGMVIQMHFLPWHAPAIARLASELDDVAVVLDHLARAGQGEPDEYRQVLELARLPRVYMKFSGVRYSSKQDFPYPDAKPIVRRAYDAFGPDRMIWGGAGHNLEEFDQAIAVFDEMFNFAAETDRVKIRGVNAVRLFRFLT